MMLKQIQEMKNRYGADWKMQSSYARWNRSEVRQTVREEKKRREKQA
jgi:hypothetical protein